MAPPSNHAIRPSSLVSLKWRCSIGRRMSQSMSRTFLPWRAKEPARLQLIIVLPSPGMVEVTRIDLGKSNLDWILTAL